jgi:hypothetical protein
MRLKIVSVGESVLRATSQELSKEQILSLRFRTSSNTCVRLFAMRRESVWLHRKSGSRCNWR